MFVAIFGNWKNIIVKVYHITYPWYNLEQEVLEMSGRKGVAEQDREKYEHQIKELLEESEIYERYATSKV